MRSVPQISKTEFQEKDAEIISPKEKFNSGEDRREWKGQRETGRDRERPEGLLRESEEEPSTEEAERLTPSINCAVTMSVRFPKSRLLRLQNATFWEENENFN